MNLTAAWFWPRVSSRRDALFAIAEAFWISVAVSTFTFIFVLIEFLRAQESGLDIVGLANSILFAGVAFGTRRKSRVAATAGLGIICPLTYVPLASDWFRKPLNRHSSRIGTCPRRARDVCVSRIATTASRDAKH